MVKMQVLTYYGSLMLQQLQHNFSAGAAEETQVGIFKNNVEIINTKSNVFFFLILAVNIIQLQVLEDNLLSIH